VIVSLLYKLSRRLLSVPAVLLRRDSAKDAELLVLRHENAVLRRHVAGPVRYETTDRFWFAALSSLIPRRRWRDAFPDTPATLLTWHRKFIAAKLDYTAHRGRIGRPGHPLGDQETCPAPSQGEPPVGTSANPGRTGPARAPGWRLDRLGDPQRSRH